MSLRIVHPALILHLSAVPALGQETTANTAVASPSGAVEEAVPEPTLAEQAEAAKVQAEAELAAVRAQIAESQEQIDAADAEAPPAFLTERLNSQRELEALIQRQLTTVEQVLTVSNALAELRQAAQDLTATGLTEEPPFDLAFVDELRDARERLERQLQTANLTVATAERGVTRAQSRLEDASAALRAAEAALREAQDGENRIALEQAAMRAQLGERIAKQRLETAQWVQRMAALDATLTERRLEVARFRVDRAADDISFTEEDLAARIESIAKRREELESRVSNLLRTRDANTREFEQAIGAMQNGDGEASREEVQARLLARASWQRTSSDSIQYLEDRLEMLVRAEELWQRRFDLLNGLAGDQLDAWAQDMETRVAEWNQRIEVVEARLNEMRGEQLDLAQRLERPESAPVRDELESMQNAIESNEERAREYLASLVEHARLAARVQEEVENQRAERPWYEQVAFGEFKLADVGKLWNYEVFVVEGRGIYVRNLVMPVIVFLAVMAAMLWVRRILRTRVIKWLIVGRNVDKNHIVVEAALAIIRETHLWFIFAVSFYAAARSLNIWPADEHTTTESALNYILLIATLAQIAMYVSSISDRILERTRRQKAAEDPASVSAFGLFRVAVRVVVWSIVLITILRAFNVPLTTFVASLGIGGVAIAFGLQSILGDLFNSIALLLDKPFNVGDFVMVDDKLGVVDSIGLKTTRIRSLSGEELILSNSDLIGSRIHNFKRMEERRVPFMIGVVYETPSEKLQMIPKIAQEIIEAQPYARFDRAHFFRFGDFSLDFEIVYYVEGPDYTRYMDTQQAINLGLFKRFEAEGINFAYPTRELVIRPQKGQAAEAEAS